jgi:2OG-Fe(II) oxygenase superfamily
MAEEAVQAIHHQQQRPVSRRSRSRVLETTASELSAEMIQALSQEEVLVIQVKRFVSDELCEVLSVRAEDEIGYRGYLNVPSVRRIGMAFYETENKPEIIESYFAQARQNILDFRTACAPYCSPIDTLRCTLDEVWPAGANLLSLSGRKMFVGLSRMVAPGTTFLAHHDLFEEDAPGSAESAELEAQFGANVYIKMPREGGELLMWEKEIPSKIFSEMRGAEYGLEVHRLGEPDLKLKPGRGDLLLFNSRKMHAVAPGKEINRLALSCFVGYRGRNRPLTFWS